MTILASSRILVPLIVLKDAEDWIHAGRDIAAEDEGYRDA